MLWLLACTTSEVDSAAEVAGEPELQFSFAAIADPHIAGTPEYTERLQSTVDWIDANRGERSIELVVVLGDIGWGEGLETAASILETLEVPFVPVIGDNEGHFGSGEDFDALFAEQFAELEELGTDWVHRDVPVYDPVSDQDIWLQNYAFTYLGLRWVICDWASRVDDVVLGETGALHDYDGGTLSFLEEQLEDLEAYDDESLILATHNPMFLIPGGFDLDQSATVNALTAPVGEKVAMNLAGHFHIDHEESVEDGGYDVYVVDAVWDDVKTVRMIEVWFDGVTFTYEHELVIVP